MKHFLIAVALCIALSSCSGQKIQEDEKVACADDSVLILRLQTAQAQRDTLAIKLLYLSYANDTLKTKLFLANYKVEKVKFYLNICKKNPSQVKFLRGWVTRAVE